MKTVWLAGGLLMTALVSCSNSSKGPELLTLSQRIDQSYGYKQDEKGNWVPKNYKKSSFELQRNSPYFNKQLSNKEYKTDKLDKQMWEGTKDFEHKSYEVSSESSATKERSRFNSQSARDNGKNFALPSEDYKTSEYATSDARENNGKRMPKPVDAETEERRRTYIKPKIIDYEQQRDLSIEQSKSLLGR